MHCTTFYSIALYVTKVFFALFSFLFVILFWYYSLDAAKNTQEMKYNEIYGVSSVCIVYIENMKPQEKSRIIRAKNEITRLVQKTKNEIEFEVQSNSG